jgi:hypothetical protein
VLCYSNGKKLPGFTVGACGVTAMGKKLPGFTVEVCGVTALGNSCQVLLLMRVELQQWEIVARF